MELDWAGLTGIEVRRISFCGCSGVCEIAINMCVNATNQPTKGKQCMKKKRVIQCTSSLLHLHHLCIISASSLSFQDTFHLLPHIDDVNENTIPFNWRMLPFLSRRASNDISLVVYETWMSAGLDGQVKHYSFHEWDKRLSKIKERGRQEVTMGWMQIKIWFFQRSIPL